MELVVDNKEKKKKPQLPGGIELEEVEFKSYVPDTSSIKTIKDCREFLTEFAESLGVGVQVLSVHTLDQVGRNPRWWKEYVMQGDEVVNNATDPNI